MVSREKKRLLRSPAILVVVFAVLLAMTGLVYTHWSTTARVEGQINTGGISISYWDHFTNDDGQVNLLGPQEWDPFDGDENWPPGVLLDMNQGYSSVDPATGFKNLDGFFDRYEKDVAHCYTELRGDEAGDYLYVEANNTYPSYYCTALAQVVNNGSVPIKAEPTRIVGAQEVTHECDGLWWFERIYNEETGLWEYSNEVLGAFPPGSQYDNDDGGPFVNVPPLEGFDPGGGDVRISYPSPDDEEYLDFGDDGWDPDDPNVFAGCNDVVTELELIPDPEGPWYDAFRPDGGPPVLNLGFDEVLCGFQLDPGYGFCDGLWYADEELTIDLIASDPTLYHPDSEYDDDGTPFINQPPVDPGVFGPEDYYILYEEALGFHYVELDGIPGYTQAADDPAYPGCQEFEPTHYPMQVRMHVKQPALQYATYRFQVEQVFRNWNEFDEQLLCNFD